MKESDVILTPIPQADGKIKLRPAILLREMPGGYHDVLVCGVSTQTQLRIPDFDEIIALDDDDFTTSGLMKESLIRLGFLAVIPTIKIAGSTGSISRQRHRRLLHNLSKYLLYGKGNHDF